MSPAPKQPDQSTYSGRFAARLRQLREKAGLSVEEVVALVTRHNDSGRSSPAVPSYYKWEQGSTSPHIDLIPVIARALKLKPRDLLPEK